MAGAPPPRRHGARRVGPVREYRAGQFAGFEQHVDRVGPEQLRLEPGQRGGQHLPALEVIAHREHLTGRPVRADPALAQQDHPAGPAGQPSNVVGDGDDGDPGPGPDAVKQPQERPHVVGVLPGSRLVEHEHAGGADQERRERQPLPAALAQLPRAVLLPPAEAEELDRIGHVEHRVLGPGAEPEPEFQLLEHRGLEQHVVGRLEQQRHLRRVVEDLAGADRPPAEPHHPAARLAQPTVRPVSVDLAEPFAPMSATHSPSSTARVTSSTARLPSNSTLTPSHDSTGGVLPGARPPPPARPFGLPGGGPPGRPAPGAAVTTPHEGFN